jgi:hypothetical protein
MFQNWIDFLLAIIWSLTLLTWIPAVGTNPDRARDYTVWAAYIFVAAWAMWFMLGWSYESFLA